MVDNVLSKQSVIQQLVTNWLWTSVRSLCVLHTKDEKRKEVPPPKTCEDFKDHIAYKAPRTQEVVNNCLLRAGHWKHRGKGMVCPLKKKNA